MRYVSSLFSSPVPTQPQYLTDAMHGMPPRSAYPRDMYPPPPPSAAFIRERVLSTYTVPDPRVILLLTCKL